MYFVLITIFKIKDINTNHNYDAAQELKKLGKMQLGEKIVSVIFVITTLCWILQPYINKLLNIKLTDEIIAIIALFALFIIPVNLKEKKFLMDLEHFKKVPWDILLLFGGGLALSQLFIKSQLSNFVANNLGFTEFLSIFSILFIIVIIIVILTEFTSNTAIIATFLPLIAALAVQFDINLLLISIPLAIGASCAFMLPVSTPPNAIIFGSGQLKILDMVKAGVTLSIASIIIIPIYCYYMIPLIFK